MSGCKEVRQRQEQASDKRLACTQGHGKHCGNCGAAVSDKADICELCGHWLLEGVCRYCYTPVSEGQKFCSQCGNPPLGTTCPHCGRLSHFDFCPGCKKPVTEQAQASIEAFQSMPEIQEVARLLAQTDSGSVAAPAPPRSTTAKLTAYLSRTAPAPSTNSPAGASTPVRPFTLQETDGRNMQSNMQALEQSRAKVSNLEQQQRNKIAQDLLASVQRKTFANNQDARRFYSALTIAVPELVQKVYTVSCEVRSGWRCNCYGNVHEDGPSGCASPGDGGCWEYTQGTRTETRTETEMRRIDL